MSITLKAIKNSTYNLIGFIWNSLLFLIVTPVMVYKLGTDNYGVIALTTVLSGFLNFLDFGFTGASVKQISESYARRDFKRINEIINLSMLIYVVIGVFISVAMLFLINTDLIHLFKVEGELLDNFKFSLYVTSIIMVVFMIFNVLANIPFAMQMSGVKAKYDIIISTATNALIIGALLLGAGLKVVMLLKLASYVFGVIVYYFVADKLVSGLRIKFFFDRELFREMFSFSIFNFITQLSYSFFGQFDKVLLGTYVNMTSITYYTVPASSAAKFSNSIASITQTIFPMTSELNAINAVEKIKKLYCKSIRYVSFISFAAAIPLFIFSENILSIWMGRDFAVHSSGILRIFLLGYLLSITNISGYYMFSGLNLPKVNTLYVVLYSLLRVAVCFTLIPRYGTIGAAISFLASYIPAPFFAAYCEKRIGVQGLYFLKKVYMPLMITSVIVVGAFQIARYTGVNIFMLLVLVLSSVLVFCVLLYFQKYFEEEDISRIKGFFKR